MRLQYNNTYSSFRSPVRTALIIMALWVQVALVPVTEAQSAANSPASAIQQAMSRNGKAGKVLGVREKTSSDGAAYYEVKILTDGKVKIFKIPRQ